VPETIQSRCSVFYFKQPTVDMLRDAVLDIAKKEKLEISKSSAELIAVLGDGSFRDTTSTLQKVLSAQTGKKMSDDEVARLLGAPKTEVLTGFLKALAARDLPGLLETVETMKDAGIDVTLFHRLIISRLRSVLLLRYGNDFLRGEVAKMYSDKDLASLSALAKEAKSISAST